MSRDNLETILNALVPYAKVELERMGFVAPVAGSLDDAGDIELHVPKADEGGTAEEFVELLCTALRYGATQGEFTATGVCMEVKAERPGNGAAVDAIAVHLEAPGESLMAFLPFERDEDGEVTYGEIFFGPADPCAFPADGVEEPEPVEESEA